MGYERTSQLGNPPNETKQGKTALKDIILSAKTGEDELIMRAVEIGGDWLVIVAGGTMPHIGCTVLAMPRESIRGDGNLSSTASVLNVTGHKDVEICRYVAEKIAACTGKTVVCTGGIHIDEITSDQISSIREMTVEMTERLVEAIFKK